MYVANGGAGGSNYTGFRLSGSGHLSAISGSTYPLPDDAQPGDVLFNRDGHQPGGTRVNTSQIDSFAVDGSGRLHAAAGSPFTAQGLGPFGSEFRPTNPHQLFVSNAHGGANIGSVSAFSVAGNGNLSSIGSSPFADRQTAPCWVEISHDGNYLFTVNTAVPSISRTRSTATARCVCSAAPRSTCPAGSARSTPGSRPTAALCSWSARARTWSARFASTAAA